MKFPLLLLPLLLAGCLSEEQMMTVVNPCNRPGTHGSAAPGGYRPASPYEAPTFSPVGPVYPAEGIAESRESR